MAFLEKRKESLLDIAAAREAMRRRIAAGADVEGEVCGDGYWIMLVGMLRVQLEFPAEQVYPV